SQTRVIAALGEVGKAQDTMFQMREELARLQEDNGDLRAKLKAHDDWDARLAKYRLATTPGAAIVYESTEAPPHYACPNCTNERKIQPLQDQGGESGLFDCPSCKARYRIRVAHYGGPSGPIRGDSIF